jgi:hypothetical protein
MPMQRVVDGAHHAHPHEPMELGESKLPEETSTSCLLFAEVSHLVAKGMAPRADNDGGKDHKGPRETKLDGM